MTFPRMDVEQLARRRRELLTCMSTEYVSGTRAAIRGAVLRLDAEILERRGFVYDQEDIRFLDSLRERMDDVSQTIQAMRRRETLRKSSSEPWRGSGEART